MSFVKYLYFLLFFCLSSILYSQTNIDSLNALLPTAEGTEKVDLLNSIAWNLKFADPARAFKLCDEGLELAESIEYLSGQAEILYSKAVLLQLKGDYDNSFAAAEQALSLFKELNNALGVARIWNVRAISFVNMGKFSEALSNYEKALTIAESLDEDDFGLGIKGNMAAIFYNKGEYSEAIEQYQVISSEYLEKKDSVSYYLFLGQLGKCYYRLGNYTESLRIYLEKADYEKLTNQKYRLADTYNDIGLLYSKLELYEESLSMLEQSIQLYKELGSIRRIGVMNLHLGNHYGKVKDLEKSDSFFLKTLQIYDSIGVENTGPIYNNLAENKMQRKEFDEAIELLNQSLEINQRNEIQNLIALNYTNLGTTYFELKQLKKAEEYFLKAMEIWNETGNSFEIEIVSSSLAEIYQEFNNQEDYEYYSSLAKTASDSLFNKQKLLSINRMLVQNLRKDYERKSKETQAELSEVKTELSESESKYKSFINQFAIPLVLISLILLVGIFWLYKKQKQTSQLNQSLKNSTASNQEHLETSLTKKNKELTLLSLEMAQQSDLFKKIKTSLQQIITENPENEKAKKLEKMLNSHSIDQHNWENFKTYFNEVYAGFLDRLSESFPSITSTELRLCALIRLRIPTYEASIILGVSPSSIHKSRYRIRKKMNLSTEANMDEFICSI